MDKVTYVGNADVNAIEHLYQSYTKDPESVDIGWQKFFEGFDFARTNYEDGGEIPENFQKEFKVINLINGYRTRGHLFTKTNPVRERRKYEPTLAIENFGLEASDMETVFQAGDQIGIGPATLETIIGHLQETYCQSIGIEYMFMREPDRLNWFHDKIELKNRPKFDAERKIHVYKKLLQASSFEAFLGKKYVGQKRFSIEGGESLIPALDALVEKGADLGVEYFVMGMAHRGRLNTLTNIFQKRPQDIFSEFEGKEFDADSSFDGDVKYHQGYTSSIKTKEGKEIGLTLSPNPSHLEAVDPVVQGIARAKLDHHLKDENKICPVMIHGDAAVAGQGVVYEVIQMALLDGYRAGGTIHIVVNNQVGFTTNFYDARSSTYCTDVAKTTLSPVFHVNGDDVEAVIQTIEIAMEYRQKFHRDVFIDLLCYRKYGHNEGDEPKFTQPNLYNIIAKHPNPKDIYLKQIAAEGAISNDGAKKLEDEYNDYLENEFEIAHKKEKAVVWNFLSKTWEGFRSSKPEDFESSPETGIKKEKLVELGRKLATLPEGKKYFRKIQKIFDDRLAAIENDNLDWGTAEMLAYATLLDEGVPVRISGQDVERGTFSHRHAVVKTEDNEEEIETLNMLSDNQAPFTIYNSLLSEYAVLGFEYGYSLATPKGLTIWEAQFGDFFNGAQIIVDQFITAGEDKWSTQSGLVMLLPHGYEGQGAEHSSGRIERFLQQCADENIQVVNTSTPANHFHLLRRQLARPFRKPLVVFSPKMLLRYPAATSSLEEMASGTFHEVLDDPTAKAGQVDTLIFCSGKFYYELKEKAAEMGVENLAFVRVEQLYPLPQKQIDAIVAKYNAKNILWAQEEPENMGAWTYIAMNLRHIPFTGITRPASAAAAEGAKKLHERRLKQLFTDVFQYASVTAK
ncbi:2-oxoglutarate dehydrogenase E1 component [Fluviicola sp.]|jgi:2-oxoglutarate dehydrogenase E1 component|uniref:2-oxoglutarate dehydrogenase E1 component n=1 Tax=Fluviicola sp. TaxID=1917219 RepID=UPI00282FA3E1|nr:2-oxoglutarate dehydrogenase E1 component [Fluviicola sp.]MDR0802637.1 2-oxoglutarate dehydrogenase E1 component [Fluviicola sp.]